MRIFASRIYVAGSDPKTPLLLPLSCQLAGVGEGGLEIFGDFGDGDQVGLVGLADEVLHALFDEIAGGELLALVGAQGFGEAGGVEGFGFEFFGGDGGLEEALVRVLPQSVDITVGVVVALGLSV